MKYDVADLALAAEGKKLIEWARRDMPVLQTISQDFSKKSVLKGVKLAACLHVTSETANLMIALKQAGADVVLCASNPLSTNDAVAASLVKDYKIPTYAIKGENNKTYYNHLYAALDFGPNQTMDDGADLVGLIHTKYKHLISSIVGSTEETTTGVIRLRAMEADGTLKIPVLAVNDNMTKHMFDNRYGTGQSTIDGVLRATNMLIAGKTVVVCGYGWCGRGVAMRARGLGADVVVTEIDPLRALEARMDGYRVMKLLEAVKEADLIISVTGNKHVVDAQHMKAAKNGVVLAQSGHFDVEINKNALKKLAKSVRQVRPFVQEYDTGRKVFYLLGEGRLINLAAAEGHPASVMDMSFAGQAMAARYMWEHRGKLQAGVHQLPHKLDADIARMKLKAEGIAIDALTSEQKTYLQSWQEGTAA